jgi:hypothetical protein
MNLFDMNLIHISEHITSPRGNTIELVIGIHVITYEKLIDGFEVVFDVQFDGVYMEREIRLSEAVKTFWKAALLDAYWEKPGTDLVHHQEGLEWLNKHTNSEIFAG